jgi:hypothetical protein
MTRDAEWLAFVEKARARETESPLVGTRKVSV